LFGEDVAIAERGKTRREEIRMLLEALSELILISITLVTKAMKILG
jgi:hypothetical protein